MKNKGIIAFVAVFCVLLAVVAGNVHRLVYSGPKIVSHELGAPFLVNGKQVTFSNPRRVEMPEKFWADLSVSYDPVYANHAMFLVVDASISTVDPNYDNGGVPNVLGPRFSNGACPSANFPFYGIDDRLIPAGLNLISYSDFINADGDVSGQLCFPIERVRAADELTLTIPEDGRTLFYGSPFCKALHTLTLDLYNIPSAAASKAA